MSTPILTDADAIKAQFSENVLSTYAPGMVLVRGEGSRVWDSDGKAYLDFGGGIAVNVLGQCHPAVRAAIEEQAGTLMHVSNLYHHPWQGALAQRLVELTGPGKIFFSNSGAEANELFYKLARLVGQGTPRYETITALNSFHGRTLAGIAATGQDKVKAGFDPPVPGFKHATFNDVASFEAAIDEKTSAILIEGIQGEGGIHPARPEFLLGLRELCDKHDLLLLFDAIQCGMFRTGCFQSYERVLEGCSLPGAKSFRPDGISMAKSLGGGFPMGAVWLAPKVAERFKPGMHGTTYGGGPLACRAALAVLDTIDAEDLVANIRRQSDKIVAALHAHIATNPPQLRSVRGFGGMLGLEVASPPLEIVPQLVAKGLITVPAGSNAVRLLMPLNITDAEVEEALGILISNL